MCYTEGMEGRPIYLVVTQHFPAPGNWRGAFVLDFVRAVMRTRRFEVRVMVPGRGEDFTVEGVKVWRFRRRALRSAVLPFLFRRWNRAAFFGCLKRMGVEPERVAVCHAHGVFMGDYALALKARSPGALAVLHHHDLASFGIHLGVLRHVRWHQRRLYGQLLALHGGMDAHVFVSARAARAFLEMPLPGGVLTADYRRSLACVAGLPAPQVRRALVLFNGVDGRLFAPNARRRGGAGFVMGCVGNFVEGKDQAVLLRALAGIRAQLPEGWRLRLVGSGPERGACERLVRELELEQQVSFEAERAHGAMAAFYAELDLFVLPASFEAFGCVFAEAAACGVPVIGCIGQGLEEWTGAGYPGLVRPGDAAALGARILDFVRAPWAPPEPPAIDAEVPRFLERLLGAEKRKGAGA